MRKTLRFIYTIGMLGMTLLALLVSTRGVSGQPLPSIAVKPAAINLPLGNSLTLDLTVRDGQAMNAFDVTLHYDPDLLSLTDWAFGDYLTDLATVYRVNEPGVLRIAATQLAQPAVSGDGVLLKLTFDSKDAGVSQIELTAAVFADRQGIKTFPTVEHGAVTVTLDATFTPTPAPSHTPTMKPTLTQTAKPTLTTTLDAYPVETDPPKASEPSATAPARDVPRDGPETREPVARLSRPTRTLAATESQTEAPAAALMSATPTTTPIGITQGSASAGVAHSDGGESAPPANQLPPPANGRKLVREDVLNLVLWGVLILALAALLGMLRVVFQRKDQTEKDLLL